MSQPLSMFVVYKNPADFPRDFVVRRFTVHAGYGPVRVSATLGCVRADSVPLAVVPSLERAREAIPRGLVRLARHHDDEPQIVEVWI